MAQLSAPALLTFDDVDTPKPRNNALALWVGVAVFAAMSVWMAFRSKGFLEADACTHYMMARHAFNEPHYFTSVWGRPLCTGLYAIPAYFGGVIGVRLMSLLLAVLSGLITYRIAVRQNYRLPALAAILLFAQPLFYLHSFSELTEIPFAFVAVCAFWAYQSRQFLAMTLLVAITPSGRPEGFMLIALAACALLLHRRWYYLFLLPLPMVLWSYLGWLSWGSPPELPWYRWLPNNWPYAPKSAYGSGPWYHFLLLLPVLVSPMVFPALLPGVWLSVRNGLRRWTFFTDHVTRCQVMIALIPLGILFVHSVLWFFGLMASNGELRYLLCVAPLWALLCAKGWEWMWGRFRLPAPFLCAALAAFVPAAANWYYRVIPLRLYAEDYMSRAAAEWYLKEPGIKEQYPLMMASPPGVYFRLDRSAGDQTVSAPWGQKTLKNPPPGVVMIWDPIYGPKNADANLIIERHEIAPNGWRFLKRIEYEDKWCEVYLSPAGPKK